MFQRIRSSLLADERGLTTVEYVIVLCLIAALSVGLWRDLGNTIKDHLTTAIRDIKTELAAEESGSSAEPGTPR